MDGPPITDQTGPATNESTLLMRTKSLEIKLKKFCHTKDCKKELEMCPIECGCEKELGLDTSLAWNLSHEIEWLSTFYISTDKQTEKGCFNESKDYIKCMHSIVSRHHKNNKELDILTFTAVRIVGDFEQEFPFKED